MQEENQNMTLSLKTRIVFSTVFSLLIGVIAYFVFYVLSVNYDNTPRGEADPEWSPLCSNETLLKISIVVAVISFLLLLVFSRNEPQKAV
jgi:heme/copper-type cytochrome/quinol oxidase subunit 2